MSERKSQENAMQLVDGILAAESLPTYGDLRAELAALREQKPVFDVSALIEKVRDYGQEIGNAECCEAAYDKTTARMHRKYAEDAIAEITAMFASPVPSQSEQDTRDAVAVLKDIAADVCDNQYTRKARAFLAAKGEK